MVAALGVIGSQSRTEVMPSPHADASTAPSRATPGGPPDVRRNGCLGAAGTLSSTGSSSAAPRPLRGAHSHSSRSSAVQSSPASPTAPPAPPPRALIPRSTRLLAAHDLSCASGSAARAAGEMVWCASAPVVREVASSGVRREAVRPAGLGPDPDAEAELPGDKPHTRRGVVAARPSALCPLPRPHPVPDPKSDAVDGDGKTGSCSCSVVGRASGGRAGMGGTGAQGARLAPTWMRGGGVGTTVKHGDRRHGDETHRNALGGRLGGKTGQGR